MNELATQALELIEASQRARRESEAAEAIAWVEFARTYDSGLGAQRVVIGGVGSPAVDEFAHLELAAALHRSKESARLQLVDLLDLAHRLPRLWQAAVECRMPLWLGRRVAGHTRGLSPELAGWVDTTLAPFVAGLSATRVEEFALALVVQADPDAAAAARERASGWRGVRLQARTEPGTAVHDLQGLLDSPDALLLDKALDQLAGVLARQGTEGTHDQRRAVALGVLATPTRALSLIQHDLSQAALPTHDPRSPGGADCDLAGTPGHACGRITVDPDRLQPTATLVVHLSETSLQERDGLCRVEGVGAVALTALQELLGTCRVRVLPILDTAGVPAVDAYEIPTAIRRAVTLRHHFEVFPYSGRSHHGCDLDHTIPWLPEGPPGLTGIDNLAPLGRTVHRAKTHSAWRLIRPGPGVFVWTSPLGRSYTLTADGLTRAGPPGADSAPDHRAS